VRNLLDGIVADDQKAIEAAINPIYSNATGEVGVGDLIRLAELGDLEIRDLKLSAEFDAERKNARVFLSGTIVTPQGEAKLDNKVLLTSIMGERWYVTSPNSEYWASQLRPPPAAWRAVRRTRPDATGVYVPPHPGADGQLLNGGTDDRPLRRAAVPITAGNRGKNISGPLCYPSDPPTSGPTLLRPRPSASSPRRWAKSSGAQHGARQRGHLVLTTTVRPSKLTAVTAEHFTQQASLLDPLPGMGRTRWP
jgi:hypothetical protein